MLYVFGTYAGFVGELYRHIEEEKRQQIKMIPEVS